MYLKINFFFNIILFFLSSCILFIGYISSITLNGDNANYFRGWKTLTDTSFFEAFKLHSLEVGSIEPVYFIFAFLTNSFLNYEMFILLLNLFFLISIYLFFKKYFRNYMIMYTYTIITNVYVYVAILETHRLKLAIMFFLLSIVFIGKRKYFTILSILSHLQIILIYISIELNNFIVRLLKFKLNYKIFIFFILIILIIFIFNSHIISKLQYYQFNELPIKTILLVFCYCFYIFIFNIKRNSFFYSLVFVVLFLSFFISGDRLNLFIVTYIVTVELNDLLHNKKELY